MLPRHRVSLESCAASIGVDLKPGTPVSRRCQARLLHDRRKHGVARGLEVSSAASARNSLSSVRSDTAETIVLSLHLFESLHPIALRAAVLVPPSIVRDFAYRSDRVCDLAALCHQHINLPQFRNDLLSRMPLSCHRSYPPSENHTSGRTTSKRADHTRSALRLHVLLQHRINRVANGTYLNSSC